MNSGARLREYLLGGLSEAERQAIEDRFFAEDDFADTLRETECDLLDEYARGTLTGAERDRVEQRLLASPDARARLAASRMLAGRAPARPARRFDAVRWVGWAAAIAAGIALLWFAAERDSLRRQLAARPPAAPAPIPQADAIASVHLTAPVSRDSGRVPLSIPVQARVVRVELPSEPGYTAYNLSIVTSGGSRVYTATVQVTGDAAIAWAPADLLPAGEYDFLLSGVRGGTSELIASFPCRIVRP